MSNRMGTPVAFTLEKNVSQLSCNITFGALGVPTKVALNSKGFCNVTQNTVSFTATGTSTTSITGVSNFTGLYNGMILTGTNVAANSIISALNPGAGTFTLSQATTGAITAVTATGGYTLQLGTQAGVKLDTYVKLLGLSVLNDLTALQGGVSTGASAPAASHWFMTNNSVSKAGLASVTLMCGTGNGATFVQVNPASGEAVEIQMMLGGSTAI